MLVNGLPSDSVSTLDRGLNYGDGVFRTLLIKQGRVHCWARHYLKLQQDCAALRLDCPSEETLISDIVSLTSSTPNAVAKIVITRGVGQRGYAIQEGFAATRIVSITAPPPFQAQNFTSGIRLHRCFLKLGHQPRLAGIKHLNRLENVLAATECLEEGAPEGLLEDEDGLVISGTRSNLFVIRGGTLYTPDLSQCGVAGIQRERVMDWSKEQGGVCKITPMRFEELLQADEIFMVNSVFGLWPVAEVDGYKRSEHPISWKIQEWLNDEND
ncbi:MAG: 4-amino-4-deoxychorismate lyase [Gallionellaceae bacterium]|nr:MAG: 4-amino-4-deoxychorismate lyase [Gallionellaceae bacterium]